MDAEDQGLALMLPPPPRAKKRKQQVARCPCWPHPPSVSSWTPTPAPLFCAAGLQARG